MYEYTTGTRIEYRAQVTVTCNSKQMRMRAVPTLRFRELSSELATRRTHSDYITENSIGFQFQMGVTPRNKLDFESVSH